MTLSPQLLAVLVCPRCKGPLAYREGAHGTAEHAAEHALDCARCRLRYPVRDDIPIMLVDEAVPLASA